MRRGQNPSIPNPDIPQTGVPRAARNRVPAPGPNLKFVSAFFRTILRSGKLKCQENKERDPS